MLPALLPPAVALVAVLGFRLSGLLAAAAACITALTLWIGLSIANVGPAIGPIPDPTMAFVAQGGRALIDAGLLTAIVMLVIVPGIVFVEVSRRRGSPDAVARLVGTLRLPPAQTAILVAAGFGVLLETLTGMGVSLLVVVPLLIGLVPRRAAIGLALVGASLFPWGGLGLAGIVGAKLAAVPLVPLSLAVSFVSGAVAMLLPLLCLWFVPDKGWNDWLVALAAGVALAAAIAVSSAAIGIEVAGVAGGIAVIALMAILAERRGTAAALSDPALRPYAILIAVVIAQKAAVAALVAAGLAAVIDSGRIQFPILSSPGISLLAAAVLSSRAGLRHDVSTREFTSSIARRAWRPIATVAMFMLSARLAVETGAIAVLARTVSGFGTEGAIVATALLGALGGFATGSGVSGNALFMPSAAETGRALGNVLLFAAVQNGAAGHTAMASLPVAAILLAALPDRQPGDDRTVMTLGLGLAAIHVTVVIAMGLAWARIL